MKKLAFSVLAAVLLISACKKDDDEKTASSFTIDNNAAVSTPYGFIQDYGVDGNDISFASFNPTVDSTYTGKVSYFQFSLDTLVPGTYTYFSDDSTGFDATKHFSYANCKYNANAIGGVIDFESGIITGDPTAGTITMKKNGETYTFTYAIQFEGGKVTGTYIGKPVYTKEN